MFETKYCIIVISLYQSTAGQRPSPDLAIPLGLRESKMGRFQTVCHAILYVVFLSFGSCPMVSIQLIVF